MLEVQACMLHANWPGQARAIPDIEFGNFGCFHFLSINRGALSAFISRTLLKYSTLRTFTQSLRHIVV